MDSGGAVYDLDADHPINRYEAESQLAANPTATSFAWRRTLPPARHGQYLKLPPLDIRIPKLAEKSPAAPSNYDKAVALEQYLSTHFGYTLELPAVCRRTRWPISCSRGKRVTANISPVRWR
jgi:transglutaminase-like putative cysteine protease